MHKGEPTEHELYQRACDHGIARGCVQVLHDQLTQPRSLDAAMRKLDQWCSRGESTACEELALAYDLSNAPQETERVFTLTNRACALGDLGACVRVGILHELKWGVPKNDTVARWYFKRACERGAPLGCRYFVQDAMVVGGVMLQEVPPISQRGCEMGDTEACGLLIKFYIATHDEPALLHWATEACRMGSFAGCLQLIVRDIELPKTIQDPVELYHNACNVVKIPAACQRLPKLVQAEDDLLRGVVAAVAKQDTATFAKLVANEVNMRDLRFNDPDCATQFSGTIALTAAQHPAFIQCLAKLAVRVEPAPDYLSTPLLAYEPDVSLAVDVRDGVVQRIWRLPSAQAPSPPPPPPPLSSGSTNGAAPSTERPPPPPLSSGPTNGAAPSETPPSVAPATADANRIAGEKNIVPDDETKTAIYLARSTRLVGSFKLLITAHGTIANVVMLKSTGFISYDRTIERRLYGWKYRPFTVNGKPTPVWTAVTFIYSQR